MFRVAEQEQLSLVIEFGGAAAKQTAAKPVISKMEFGLLMSRLMRLLTTVVKIRSGIGAQLV